MNTKKPVRGAQAKTRIERASAASNHDKPGLRVKAGLKAGKLTANHSLGLRVNASGCVLRERRRNA